MMAQTPQKDKARWPLFLSVAKVMAHPPPVTRAAPIGKIMETRAPGFIDLLHEQLLFKEDGWFRRGRRAALVR
jgi:hypothetical protein